VMRGLQTVRCKVTSYGGISDNVSYSGLARIPKLTMHSKEVKSGKVQRSLQAKLQFSPEPWTAFSKGSYHVYLM